MKKTLISFLAIILGFQTLVYSQTDTIYNRYRNYYYSSWYDSCYNAGLSCDFLGAINSPYPHMTGIYQFTEEPLEIIGIAGGVVTTEFADTTRVPEYFMLYDEIDGRIVLVDSARWDTATPKIMGLETLRYETYYEYDSTTGQVLELIDTIYGTAYVKILETYFKSSVIVDDTFLLAGSLYNNVSVGLEGGAYDHHGYYHESTVYTGVVSAGRCKRYNPIYTYGGEEFGWGRSPQIERHTNAQYYIMFPIIKILDTFEIMGSSYDETQGTVEGSGQYIEHSTVVLTAIANEGYKFTMWNDSVTTNPRTIIASRDTAFTAYFAPLEQYTVSVESNDPLQGTVSGGGTYYETTTAVLTATPNEGYKFTMWNDSVTDNPRNIVVSQDTLFTAYFEVKIGINEAGNNAELFTISPNPTTNNLQISIGESGNYTMEIYSANGTMVRQEQINHSSTVDVSTLSAGNYFIKIYNGTTSGIRAFVKQ